MECTNFLIANSGFVSFGPILLIISDRFSFEKTSGKIFLQVISNILRLNKTELGGECISN